VNKNQLWVLGLVETNIKNFYIARNRDAETIKTFVTKSIPIENVLATDWCYGFDWGMIKIQGILDMFIYMDIMIVGKAKIQQVILNLFGHNSN
jgi:hypothetical protein